jgi:beta-glucosidase/6-phospho-beta-glucosidase/beta-galactosidase
MLQKQAAQGGEVGLVVDCEWAEPFSDKVEDQIAAQRRIDFQLGWYVAVHIPNATCENLSNIVYLLHLLEFFFLKYKE